MKKRNGFTLVELLGVLVVLGVIAIIVFPSVTGMIKNSKQKSYEQQKNIIASAARKWGLDNTDSLNEVRNVYVSLDDLIKGGYLTNKDVKDPRNDEIMKACIVVSFSKNYNQYEYTLEEKDCSEIKKNYLIDITNKAVTSGNGLYKTTDTEYRYRGGCTRSFGSPYACTDADPINNYIKLSNYLYRIISIDDNAVKVISAATVIEKAFEPDARPDIFAVFDISDTNTNNIGYYLNKDASAIAEIKYIRTIAMDTDFNLGKISDLNMTLAQLQTMERGSSTDKLKTKIGLLNVSDYIQSSLNYTGSNQNVSMVVFPQGSWIYTSTEKANWTLSPVANSSSFIWSTNYYYGNLASNILSVAVNSVRPVFNISSSTVLKGGDGTAANPYVIE